MINSTSRKIIYLLSWSGLVPFIAGAVLIWFDEPFDPFFVLHAFNIYSIVILAFLCGSWWGFAFSNMEDKHRIPLILCSNILLLALWVLLVFFQNKWTLTGLGLGYILLFLGERVFPALPVEPGYLKMRMVLTIVVLLCHVSVHFAMSI